MCDSSITTYIFTRGLHKAKKDIFVQLSCTGNMTRFTADKVDVLRQVTVELCQLRQLDLATQKHRWKHHVTRS